MSFTVPATTLIVSQNDVSIDLLCFDYLSTFYDDLPKQDKMSGYVEAVLDANSGLSDIGTLVPLGTRIEMPRFTPPNTQNTLRLWD